LAARLDSGIQAGVVVLLRRRRSLLAGALSFVAAVAAEGCAQGVPTSPNQPFLYPSRITVEDLSVTPSAATAGSPAVIRFRLVRAGDDGSPVYWTAYLLERPSAGGALSTSAGGPVSSGAVLDLTYLPVGPTVAFITLYPSSTPGAATGDGSGDWRSFSIEVH
jgi:hypothetical protein